jgi:cell pole-organizing protein PopZ
VLIALGLVLTACGQAAPPPATPVVIVVTATPAAKPAAATTVATAAATAPTTAPATTSPATAVTAAASVQGIGGGATPALKPTSKAQVEALWFASSAQGIAGGTSKVAVSVEKNTGAGAKELRVGFFESEVGGSGAMWRAAGWMAVITAGLLLGIDPSDYRYTYDVGGRIDGPSAGTLMTVVTMATILGHTVKSDVTMTGTINPDGTVGPVGGIPHKIDGAAKAGKKLVLIPAGQRQSVDMATKQSVDVVDRGRRQNVDVREVSDIFDAYELLTGNPLPRPAGMKEVRPALPGTSFERTKSKAKEWYTRYLQLNGQYKALPEAVRLEFTDDLMSQAATLGAKADGLYLQGLPGPAYSWAFNAALTASIGYHSAKVVEAFTAGGVDGGAKYLQAMRSVTLKVDGFLDRLETQQAASLGDVAAITEAYGDATLAMGLIAMADTALQREAKTEEAIITKLTEATLYYVLADQVVEIAKDQIDIGMGFGKAPAPSQATVESLAELFRRAAEANLSYFENVVINEIAAEVGAHPNIVKTRFASRDLTYTFAMATLNAMGPLKKRAPSGMQGAYATLGGAVQSYTMSSVLIAKYYSLDAILDDDGAVTAVTNERAMINMLDLADKRAKEIIGLDVAIGAEPVGAIISYESAKIAREGDLESKFSALQSFWTAALRGQMLGILSGKASVVK